MRFVRGFADRPHNFDAVLREPLRMRPEATPSCLATSG